MRLFTAYLSTNLLNFTLITDTAITHNVAASSSSCGRKVAIAAGKLLVFERHVSIVLLLMYIIGGDVDFECDCDHCIRQSS